MTRKSFKLIALPRVTANGVGDSSVSQKVHEKSLNGRTHPTDPELQDTRGDDENDEHRGTWGKTMEFLLSCISMSVGLGNVWRFPNVAYRNGGGAFLIPYLIVLFLVGRPLYYLELSLGQFCGQGPVKLWRCVPALKGVGVAQMVSTVYIMVFYNYLMAVTIFYLFASMQSTLPWKECDNDWADCDALNLTRNFTNTSTSLTEQYFNNFVLKKSSGLDEITRVDWRLALCLLLAWILVYCCIVKGLETLGKVAYFTALFPYVVLISLLIVALTSSGAGKGIAYLFTPQWERLKDISVWYAACEQAFFSLNIGFGALVMYSSYNNFRHNVGRDAIIISIADTFTSILAGSVIFSILGTLAEEHQIEISDVVQDNGEGMGLAFIVYPAALARIPYVPQLWSVLFFFMLFTLGIGSSMAQMETILTPIRDKYPVLRKKKWLPSLVMCIIGFSFGLTLTTDAGQYVMVLLDNYGVGTGVILYGMMEIVGVMWIYGLRNICLDLEYMMGSAVSIFWKIIWGFITVITLVVIFIYGNVDLADKVRKKAEKNETGGIPAWGNGLGWALAGVAIIQIPAWMLITIFTRRGDTFAEKLRLAFRSSKKWGPKKPDDYIGWLKFRREREGAWAIEATPPSYDNVAFEDSKSPSRNIRSSPS